MLTTNFTVKTLKDVTAEDFIASYSKHLKTQGKFEIPKVCRLCYTTSLIFFLVG